MKKFIEWIKTNTSTMIVTGLGAVFIYSQFNAAVKIDTHLKELKAQAEDAQTALALSSGQAVYMAGASCTIKTTPDITVAQVERFAKACSKAHAQYLEDSVSHRVEVKDEEPQQSVAE